MEAEDIFPVPGDRVSCGLRTDLPKKQRRHDFMPLGIDTRHYGKSGEFTDMNISACRLCGRDKMTKIKEGSNEPGRDSQAGA